MTEVLDKAPEQTDAPSDPWGSLAIEAGEAVGSIPLADIPAPIKSVVEHANSNRDRSWTVTAPEGKADEFVRFAQSYAKDREDGRITLRVKTDGNKITMTAAPYEARTLSELTKWSMGLGRLKSKLEKAEAAHKASRTKENAAAVEQVKQAIVEHEAKKPAPAPETSEQADKGNG